MGYHKKEIQKGVLGEFTKIKEEFDELSDAFEQEDKILQLCELTDLIGAIESYVENKFNLTLEDLVIFSNKTKSAFKEKKRG
jgi:hypothetical protein